MDTTTSRPGLGARVRLSAALARVDSPAPFGPDRRPTARRRWSLVLAAALLLAVMAGPMAAQASPGGVAGSGGTGTGVVGPRDEPDERRLPPPPTTGDLIAGFAAQFVGYPYVWAGNTPAGFDCSGFTQYVVLSVTGVDIGHGTEGQLAWGWPVASDALLPGDLVYFAGTWGPGITHTGVYLGGGLFVHAENEGTGVVVSDLWGTYGGYYYTAIRVW
jgi:cell wall-associated NlpC family hydrolase